MSVLWVIATMTRPCPSAMTRKSAWGLSVPRSLGSLPGPPHEKMLGTCLTSVMVNSACRIGSAGVVSTIGNSGSTRVISSLHCSHAACAPEVVHPEEPALEQVLPQALHLRIRERCSTDIRTDQHRTLEQLIVGEPHDPVVDVAAIVPADGNLGQFRQARQQVDFAKRVVGAPANPAGFRPVAAEHPLADGESTVVEVLRRNPNAGPGAFNDTKPLRQRHRAADGDQREHEGETSTQARHGWIVV